MESVQMASSETAPLSVVTSSVVNRILCYYTNSTNQLQIAKTSGSSGLKLERVVFPKQRILFEALSDAWIEIYIYSELDGVTLLNTIPCQTLHAQSKGGCD
jgi:hypothetical protein